MLADTAASHHHLQKNAERACTKVHKSKGTHVTVVNSDDITPHSNAQIPLAPALLRKAQHAFFFYDLKKGSLLSIGQVCDDDFIAIFTKYDVKILKNNTFIIIVRQNANSLWNIPFKPTTAPPPNVITIKKSPQLLPSTQHQANGVVCTRQTKQYLDKYHSGILFNPHPSTLLTAIKASNLITFPGLTTRLIIKHLPPIEVSLKRRLV